MEMTELTFGLVDEGEVLVVSNASGVALYMDVSDATVSERVIENLEQVIRELNGED